MLACRPESRASVPLRKARATPDLGVFLVLYQYMRRDHFDAWLQNFFLRMTALVKVWATKWLTKLANETPSAQILAVVR